MAFSFSVAQLFKSKTEEKISLKVPSDMLDAIDQLSEVMGLDRSKTVRWCLEAVLKEAIDQGKIALKKVG